MPPPPPRHGQTRGMRTEETGFAQTPEDTPPFRNWQSCCDSSRSVPAEDPEHPGRQAAAGSTAVSLYAEAEAFVEESMRRGTSRRRISLYRGLTVVRRMLESLHKGHDLLLLATDPAGAHSVPRRAVNVALLACGVAQALGKSKLTRKKDTRRSPATCFSSS